MSKQKATFRRQQPSDQHRWTQITEPDAEQATVPTVEGPMPYRQWCERVAEQAGGEIAYLDGAEFENMKARLIRAKHGLDARVCVVMGWARRFNG